MLPRVGVLKCQVVVDLTKVEQGAVVVSNKPERGTQEREGGG